MGNKVSKHKDLLAFVCSGHPRLGDGAAASLLDESLRRHICRMAAIEPRLKLPATVWEPVYGFKAFELDMTCRGFQYAVGCTYTMSPRSLEMCETGFHFCRIPTDVKKYYDVGMDKCRFARVQADVLVYDGTAKSVCSQITILEMLTWDQLEEHMPSKLIRVNHEENIVQQEQYKNGILSNGADGSPAISGSNGLEVYVDSKGLIHRDGGPAEVCLSEGISVYRLHGQIHRDEKEGPAVISPHGVEYYFGGVRHRNCGPAIIRRATIGFGDQCVKSMVVCYYRFGNVHRPTKEGPAVSLDGLDIYAEHNRPHRPVDEGPAFVWANPAWAGGQKLHWTLNDGEMWTYPPIAIELGPEEQSLYAVHGKQVPAP